MNHKITHLSDVEKEIAVTFPAEDIARRFAEAYHHLARTAQIRGFRPGKVPLSVLKQFYGKAVAEDIEIQCLETGLRETIVKENLHILEHPVVTQKGTLAEGQDFTFSFKVETFPTLTIVVQEYHISYTPVEFKEEMLEEELLSFRRRHTTFTKVERPARNGDRVTVTFAAAHEGKELPNVKGEAVPVIVGESRFLEGFEALLRDRNAGERFSAPLSFPEHYHSKELAGKTVDFSIEVISVEEVRIPELTDEFVASHHDKVKTVADLRDLLRTAIQRYLDNINRETERRLLVERYVRENDFPVPPSFLESEVIARREDLRKRLGRDDLSPAEEQQVRDDAFFAAKRFLLLTHFARELSVVIDDKTLDDALAAEAARYGIPLEQYKHYLGDQNIEQRRLVMREQAVIDRLAEKVVFEKKPRTQGTDQK